MEAVVIKVPQQRANPFDPCCSLLNLLYCPQSDFGHFVGRDDPFPPRIWYFLFYFIFNNILENYK